MATMTDRRAASLRLVLCDGWRGVHRYLDGLVEATASETGLPVATTAFVVPTAAAAVLLGRRLASRAGRDPGPPIVTPSALWDAWAERSEGRLRRADPLLREALVEAAMAATADGEAPPPFRPRSGLAPRILAFDERLRFAGHDLGAFVAYALDELDDPNDPGSARMTAQTRFLAGTLRRYREALAELGEHDDPDLGRRLADEAVPFPFRRLVVVGPDTLEPARLDALARARDLETIEIVLPRRFEATASVRALERFGPRLRRRTVRGATAPPALLRPVTAETGAETVAFVARDREEAVLAVARLLAERAAEGRRPPLERIAVVVPRPLPYLYLVKKLFRQAGIPYELQDDFPLAAEPFLAAVDVALELVETDGRRPAALALLRSPFFRFEGVDAEAVAALDRRLVRWREPGGTKVWRSLLARLDRLPAQPSLPGLEPVDDDRLARPAVAALVAASEELAPLRSGETGAVAKIDVLRRFLERRVRPLGTLPSAARHERARAALEAILDRMATAAARIGDPPLPFGDFRDRLRRAVEAHTFSERAGEGGIHVVDARSAGYGDFDWALLLGLNEGEWPARRERNIFYPQWLVQPFGWPADREALAEDEAAFEELVRLPAEAVGVVRHELEEEVPAVPSPFLESVVALTGGREERVDADALARIVVSRVEALRLGREPPRDGPRTERGRPGLVPFGLPPPEPVSATAFELYLRCPFKYYARYVLRVEEEEDLEEGLTPLERGRLVHEILREGFARWDAGAERPRPIDASSFDEALDLFRAVAREKLPAEERARELERLFGGPGAEGPIEWLLRREIGRPPLRRRLVEHPFTAPLRLEEGPWGERPWYVRIKGRADRVDVDEEGRLYLYDYKTGRAPEPAVALQAPLYAMSLAGELGARPAEAAYLSLRERRVVPREDYERAAAALRDVFRAVTEGRFPPRPIQDHLCETCGYAGVCRKAIDEDGEARREGGGTAASSGTERR